MVILENLVLGTYELENSGYGNLLRIGDLKFKYVDTSICYNNDYYLKELLDHHPSMKVISKIPPQMIDEYEFMVSNHLKCLGRDKIDIMLIHNSRSEWIELAKTMEKDKRFLNVGVSNFSIEDLEIYKSELGHYPKYNEIEINPNYYDKKLIEFCHSNSIKVIAYAILGGKYNARSNIARYTLPYLLTFAAMNAEFVILRSDHYTRLWKSKLFMEGLNKTSEFIDLDRIDSKLNKSIIPDTYSYPENFSFIEGYDNFNSMTLIPTNGDMIYSVGYEYKINNKVEDINWNDSLELTNLIPSIPSYEFITDYRVLFRYLLDSYIKNNEEAIVTTEYLAPSTYLVQSTSKSIFKKNDYGYLLTVLLVDKNGKLSKIKTENTKLIINNLKIKLK